MLILIDRGAGLKPFNTAQYQDRRSYYLLERALIVCRNSLSLSELQGQVVDALVGTDIAQVGFAAENDVGKPRTKVTIIKRMLGRQPETRLSAILAKQL